jgi:hypothetical protein
LDLVRIRIEPETSIVIGSKAAEISQIVNAAVE